MSKFLKTLSFAWLYLFLHIKALIGGFFQGHPPARADR